jgi:hypothetical protein
MSEPLTVIVDAGAPPNEMAAVQRAFEAHGIKAEVRDDYVRLAAGELPWVVDVTASIQWIALAFASGFAGNAGADAWTEYRSGGWRGLVHFIREIASARGNDDGTITVHDPQGPDLLLDTKVPEEALPDLADLDWPAMQDGILGWNDERKEWWFLQARRAPRGISAPRRNGQDDY